MQKKSEEGKRENNILAKMFSMIVEIRGSMVTRDEFQEFKSDVFDHVDSFVKLHQTLDTEVASLRHGYDRLDGRVTRVEKKIGLGSA